MLILLKELGVPWTLNVTLCLRSAVISNAECRYLASSSKDGSLRIWDTVVGRCEKILTGHTQSVTCVKWGGDGLLYTSSQDRTVKVWRAKDASAWCLVPPHDAIFFLSVALIRALVLVWMLYVGGPVQDPAGPRPLGQHSGPQHRLCPAHRSFWACNGHRQPPGHHWIM